MIEGRDGKERKEKAADCLPQKLRLAKCMLVRQWDSSRLWGGLFFFCCFRTENPEYGASRFVWRGQPLSDQVSALSAEQGTLYAEVMLSSTSREPDGG